MHLPPCMVSWNVFVPRCRPKSREFVPPMGMSLRPTSRARRARSVPTRAARKREDNMATATQPLAALFSDQSLVEAMLDFEIALARAEARRGIVPQHAADAIADAAQAGTFN